MTDKTEYFGSRQRQNKIVYFPLDRIFVERRLNANKKVLEKFIKYTDF